MCRYGNMTPRQRQGKARMKPSGCAICSLDQQVAVRCGDQVLFTNPEMPLEARQHLLAVLHRALFVHHVFELDERAAMLECDAGLSRQEADRQAEAEIRRKYAEETSQTA